MTYESTTRRHGEMCCRACGWWPPIVRVRRGKTQEATEAWRWRQLLEHVIDTADAETEDGRMDGPHQSIEAEYAAASAR